MLFGDFGKLDLKLFITCSGGHEKDSRASIKSIIYLNPSGRVLL